MSILQKKKIETKQGLYMVALKNILVHQAGVGSPGENYCKFWVGCKFGMAPHERLVGAVLTKS